MGEDREACFDQLYKENWRAVYAYLVRRGCDRQDSADLVSEVFSIAWERLDDIPSGHQLPWLLVTARNLFSNHVRRRIKIDEAVRRVAGMPAENVVDTADIVVAQHDDELGRALATLSPADRELLQLIAWEDLSPVDAARVLGIGRSAARVRLHRARRRLTAALESTHADDSNDRECAANVDLTTSAKKVAR